MMVKNNHSERSIVKWFYTLFFSFIVTFGVFSARAANIDVCEVPSPLASWDFNAGELPGFGDAIVEWFGDHNGLQSIPNTDLQGIKFTFRGGGPEKDSTSEWRYKINKPLSHTWEYLKFLQPSNFYHRVITVITAPTILDEQNWQRGDKIRNDKGISAKVAAVDGNQLYIVDFEQRFNLNWGAERTIMNLNRDVSFISETSKFLGYNNKFSTQWQGKYSNGGMTLETEAIMPLSGGKLGEGVCRPTINSSGSHRGTGTVKNTFFDKKPASCFDPADNGKIVEFVVERKRSSALTARDGGYRIWKRVEGEGWQLVFMNMNERIYNEGANYFDRGYVLGWSNSGFDQDTTFWLLGWQLWEEKPDFLN